MNGWRELSSVKTPIWLDCRARRGNRGPRFHVRLTLVAGGTSLSPCIDIQPAKSCPGAVSILGALPTVQNERGGWCTKNVILFLNHRTYIYKYKRKKRRVKPSWLLAILWPTLHKFQLLSGWSMKVCHMLWKRKTKLLNFVDSKAKC